MTTVSVIIPTFNNADCLDSCITSVLDQRGDFGLQILVIDDGSTDDTPQLLQRYSSEHPGIVTSLRQTNSGQSAARNRALDIAIGDYIMFVDADDMLLPGAIGTLLDTSRHTGAPIVCASYVRRPQKHPAPPETVDVATLPAHDAVATLLYRTDSAINSSLWGKIFARHIFDGLRLWEGHIYEDLDIMPHLLLRAGKIAVTHRPLYFYRRNPGSTLSVWNNRRKDMLEVVSRINAIPEISGNRALARAAQDRSFSAACNCLVNMLRHGDSDRATRRRCLDIISATRRSTLRNPHVRIRNRLAALLLSLIP